MALSAAVTETGVHNAGMASGSEWPMLPRACEAVAPPRTAQAAQSDCTIVSAEMSEGRALSWNKRRVASSTAATTWRGVR